MLPILAIIGAAMGADAYPKYRLPLLGVGGAIGLYFLLKSPSPA